jgi:large subunit ribosomal protein L15
MPHSKRKIRKKRGSRTQGYGQVGQHRGGGQRGGKGKAGFSKHKWSYTVKYDPKRFGKHGFKSIKGPIEPSINVGELDEQIEKLLSNNLAIKTEDAITVNLNVLGYRKLLGAGKVSHPINVKVEEISRLAEEKIKKAGGKILTVNNESS